MQTQEMRFSYQLTFSIRLMSEIASRYADAQDGEDTLIPLAMMDSFYVHVRLLSEFLTKKPKYRKKERLDFAPADFGVVDWSAPSSAAATRLDEYWDVVSSYVVHYGLPRVPPSVQDLDEFDVSAAAFLAMASDVLEVFEVFVMRIEANVDADAGLTVERMRSESLRAELDRAKTRLAHAGN